MALFHFYFAVHRRAMRKERVVKREMPKHTMACVTPLVQDIFDSLFQDQIDEKGLGKTKRRRCGVCEVRLANLIPSPSSSI